jgi:hypothetical protein
VSAASVICSAAACVFGCRAAAQWFAVSFVHVVDVQRLAASFLCSRAALVLRCALHCPCITWVPLVTSHLLLLLTCQVTYFYCWPSLPALVLLLCFCCCAALFIHPASPGCLLLPTCQVTYFYRWPDLLAVVLLCCYCCAALFIPLHHLATSCYQLARSPTSTAGLTY